MNFTNIYQATARFEVLKTTDRCQIAMMTLKPGDATGEKAEAHRTSDQVLLLLEGEMNGEVGDQRPLLRKGDVVIIPAGTKHRFTNGGPNTAVTFNVYSPPAYPQNT